MKTDKLENFINSHRDEFDDLQPGPEIWEKIEKRKSKTIHIDWKRIMIRVAAVVVIFVASYFFHDFMQNRNQVQNLAEETPVNQDRQMYTDLMEAEVYYTSMIDSKKTEFYEMAAGQPMLREEISKELGELDRDYRDLKEDLKDNADNEEVIVAMIQNYRLKLRILEETLAQLQQSNNVKNEKDENTTVTF
jgi:hypothetical protein